MSSDLVKLQQNGLIPFSETPDYLPENVKNSGMEGIDTKDDFKTPRIVLLQALSPQIQTFPGVAMPGNFWHTGMNISLGKEFMFVPAVASKRVILFRPREDNNGGILAFSRDGKTWQTGGNSEFSVKVKNVKTPVIWSTGKDVLSSRLTEFGSSNPEDSQSAPAAMVSYEYLAYLPDRPELSPCVLGVNKTGLPNGKTLNTSLAMVARTGKPIWCVGVRCFAEEKVDKANRWTVPNFQLAGYVPKDLFDIVQKISDTYGDYAVEYVQEEAEPVDEIKY